MSPIEPTDFVLGELDDAERAEGERLMRTDPDFRARVERLRPTVARLEELPPEAWQDLKPPPPPSRAALEREAVRAEAPSPTPPKRRRRLVLRPALAAGIACALVAAGLGIGILLSSDDSDVSGESFALTPLESGESGEGGTVKLDDGRREVMISVEGLPTSAPGEFYEAWLLSDTDEVVSLGGFRVDDSGGGELRAELPDDPANYRFFDVSLEAADGDASHSGASVLRSPTTDS